MRLVHHVNKRCSVRHVLHKVATVYYVSFSIFDRPSVDRSVSGDVPDRVVQVDADVGETMRPSTWPEFNDHDHPPWGPWPK
jgi:hypothetical protein